MAYTDLVLTVIGDDRPGLVQSLAHSVAEHGGNWLESRMAHLSGKFAGILRVRVDTSSADALVDALRGFGPNGLEIQIATSDQDGSVGGDTYQLEIVGNDRPGIVREISQALAAQQVNVEELQSECISAPMSGEMLFRATIRLRVPTALQIDELRRQLEDLAQDMVVDIQLDSIAS